MIERKFDGRFGTTEAIEFHRTLAGCYIDHIRRLRAASGPSESLVQAKSYRERRNPYILYGCLPVKERLNMIAKSLDST